jgi:hypothetical protein
MVFVIFGNITFGILANPIPAACRVYKTGSGLKTNL